MTEFAEQLARGWVRLYTLGLRRDARENRRAEIESDLWEHRRHAAATESTGLASDMLRRVLEGIPNDVSWSLETRRAAPGAGSPRGSQQGLQKAVVWGGSALSLSLGISSIKGMSVLALVALAALGVPLLAGLMCAALGSPGGAGYGSIGEDQMDSDAYRSRRVRLLVVLSACVAAIAAMWIYAESLEHWGDTRTVIFTVGSLVLVAAGIATLMLLAADLLRMRRV